MWKRPEVTPSQLPSEVIDVGEPGNVGKVDFADGEIEINQGRPTKELVMVNTGDRPIQVGSHYHIAEANKALAFDREAAFGMRLDWLSGAAFRFEPGQERKVPLTTFTGREVARGMNNVVNGTLRFGATRQVAIRRLKEEGFCFEGESYPVSERADEALKDAPLFHYNRKN